MLPTRRLLWRVARRTPILNRRQFSADVLPSLVSTASPEFAQKKEAMDALVGDFEAKVADARRGGGAAVEEENTVLFRGVVGGEAMMVSGGGHVPRRTRLKLLLDVKDRMQIHLIYVSYLYCGSCS